MYDVRYYGLWRWHVPMLSGHRPTPSLYLLPQPITECQSINAPITSTPRNDHESPGNGQKPVVGMLGGSQTG